MTNTPTGRVQAPRVTIRDVARVAGVSRQTVTRAINEMPDISQETRLRVLQTVEELGYVPNRFAIDLSRQRSLAVGLIVGSFRNPYFAQLADAFVDELRRRDWQVMVGTADQGEEKAIRAMAAHADAIIGTFSVPEEDRARAARGVPLVQLEQRATVPGVHSVDIDLRGGIADLVAGLRARGARNFAMIDAAKAVDAARAEASPRRDHFEDAVGRSCPAVVGPDTLAGGMNCFHRLLTEHPEVDTVLAFNDLMALGALQGAHAMGVAVPGTVRIAGIDGISLAEAVNPALTTLSLDSAGVAAAAAAILAEIFTAQTPPLTSITRSVRPQVVWRVSA